MRRTHAAWNWRAIAAAVSGGRAGGGADGFAPTPAPTPTPSPSPAAVYLAGHDHEGGHSAVGGVHWLTLEAIVEAPPGSTAYAVFDFHPDAIVVRGRGVATRRVLDLEPAGAGVGAAGSAV